MAEGKIPHQHNYASATSKKDFFKSLVRIKFSDLKRYDCPHFVISSSKRDYISKSKIIHSPDCAKHTPLREFRQGTSYRLLAGDPYELNGMVRGIYWAQYYSYLVVEVGWGDFLLCQIINNSVHYLQILE